MELKFVATTRSEKLSPTVQEVGSPDRPAATRCMCVDKYMKSEFAAAL